MNIRSYYSVLIFLLLSLSNLYAQDTEGIIAGQRTEEDFRKLEVEVLEKILWLEENPIATVSNDTKGMTEFILDWLTNTPYITVTYDEVFLESITTKKYKFIEKFRVTYLFGKSYYAITHVDQFEEVDASTRGIEGMVKVYSELKRMDPSAKHRQLEKYSRLVKSGKLESYVRNKLMTQETEEEIIPEPY
ncbi:MAG: hypothetical protein ABFS32_03095 [Bacteroidota bacterium]